MKDIFLPEKLGDYYLFSKRIVGIYVTKNSVYAIKFIFAARKITIEKVVQEKIVQKDLEAEDQELVLRNPIAQAISFVLGQMGSFDELRAAMPASIMVFKELTLPFFERDKIQMVISHEVEPLLPFPALKSITDFMITRILKEQKMSDVLTATVQKSYLEQFLSHFEQAGFFVDKVIVDVFAEYALFLTIAKEKASLNVIMLDFGGDQTKILYIEKGQLRFVRTILQGVSDIAKKVAPHKGAEFIEILMRSGFDGLDEHYLQNAQKALQDFLSRISLTLSSFVKEADSLVIDHMYLLGEGALIHGISDTMHAYFGFECSSFEVLVLSHLKELSFAQKSLITPATMPCFAVGFPSLFIEPCNFKQQEFATVRTSLFIKQIASIFLLTMLSLGILGGLYMVRMQAYEAEIESSTKELVHVLKKQFPRLAKVDEPVDELVDMAKLEVEKEQETWFAFSLSLQSRFLQYLLELTTRIDKESLDFVVERITIAEDVIMLKAQVKNYEALKILERELRQSPLFVSVEPQDNPRFTMKIALAQIKE